MARKIQEIKKQMTDAFLADANVQIKYGLTATEVANGFEAIFSKGSIESIYFYVVAFAIWIIEKLFDTHKSEVQKKINDLKPHSPRWYATVAKKFQYGFNLLPDSHDFNNTGKTEMQISNSKIIAFSAVVEQSRQLLIKVAKINNNDLAALTTEELQAFTGYMERVKDAGVYIQTFSGEAEKLKLHLKIYYNPLVLNSEGKRIDGATDTPVIDTIKNYLQNIEFNGTLVLADMVDRLQREEGIVIPHVVSAAYQYANSPWVPFDVLYRPMSGYVRLDLNSITINYEPHNIP